jgi:hypothetical protein
MAEIMPVWDSRNIPRCGRAVCFYHNSVLNDDGGHHFYSCGKSGVMVDELDICIPAYDRRVTELERSVEDIERKTRQAEKRKWFTKVQTRDFWEGLRDGADGEDGKRYIELVQQIICDVMNEGPRAGV